MKAHQRKARLKRARQHQAYCKARDSSQQGRGWQIDYEEFGAAFRDFENYLERGKAWHCKSFNLLLIVVNFYLGVIIGLWWIGVNLK